MTDRSRTRVIHLFTIAAIALAVAGSIASCTRRAPHQALATFVVGSVTLERPGSAAAPVAHRQEFVKGDAVTTGAASLLVIQVGEESVLQVDADSRVEISSIMENGNTGYRLESGKVLARVRPLVKGSNFTIQTKTSIAAVRGTEFGVDIAGGRPTVAVHGGAVSVTRVDDGNVPRDEVVVESGTAAMVADTITTRPVTEKETVDYREFSKVPLITDISKKSESDLKQIEREILRSGSGEKEDGTADAEGKGAGVDASEEKQGDPAAEKALVWTSKGVYGSTDEIVVGYKNLPDYRNAWISIEKASASDGSYESYQWTYSAKEGRMSFPDLNLEPGNYEVRVHYGRGKAVDKRLPFRVQ